MIEGKVVAITGASSGIALGVPARDVASNLGVRFHAPHEVLC